MLRCRELQRSRLVFSDLLHGLRSASNLPSEKPQREKENSSNVIEGEHIAHTKEITRLC